MSIQSGKKEEELIELKIRNSELMTARQKDVCSLLLKGLQNKEIAFLLNISERTVQSHRASIYKKFEVKNVVELLHYYFLE